MTTFRCLSRGEKPPLLDSKLVFDGFENDHHHGGTICGKPNISLFRVQVPFAKIYSFLFKKIHSVIEQKIDINTCIVGTVFS